MREASYPVHLEIIFQEPLFVMWAGLSSGGTIFPLRVLVRYNLKTNSIILDRGYGYEVFQNLQNGDFFFQNQAPRMPNLTVNKDTVVSIREVDTDRVLYPT